MVGAGEELRVFISVGHTLSSEQEQFLVRIEDLLRGQSIAPVTIGRTEQANGAPLQTIQQVIKMTLGTIVLAFARLAIARADEYPDTPFAAPVTQRIMPGIWNQIEAAMTVQAEHPLLILAQAGITYEGIIRPTIHPVEAFVLAQQADELSGNVKHAILAWVQSLH